MKNGMNLHIRNSFADIGQTIAEIFDVNSLDVGQSFYGEVLKCMD